MHQLTQDQQVGGEAGTHRQALAGGGTAAGNIDEAVEHALHRMDVQLRRDILRQADGAEQRAGFRVDGQQRTVAA
ncbi:MAG: hypothetical protein WA956_09695 [Stenotrophomonas sp.]